MKNLSKKEKENLAFQSIALRLLTKGIPSLFTFSEGNILKKQ